MQERSCRGTSSPAGPRALVVELRTRPPAPAAGAGQPGRELHEIFSSHLPPFPFLIDARVLPESFGEVLVHRLPPLQRPDPSAPERLVISHDRQVRHVFNVRSEERRVGKECRCRRGWMLGVEKQVMKRK